MKQITNNNWVIVAALLLAVPAAWFVFINILNELGIGGLYHASEPVLESWGIREPLGWNINLLILAGPILASLVTLFNVLKIEFKSGTQHFYFHLTIKKKWFPLAVGIFSAGLLAILGFYFFGENCKCI